MLLNQLRIRRVARFLIERRICDALRTRGLMLPHTAQLLMESSRQEAIAAAEIARDELRAGRLDSARRWNEAASYYNTQERMHARRLSPTALLEKLITVAGKAATVEAVEVVREQDRLVKDFEEKLRVKREREIEALRRQLAELQQQHVGDTAATAVNAAPRY